MAIIHCFCSRIHLCILHTYILDLEIVDNCMQLCLLQQAADNIPNIVTNDYSGNFEALLLNLDYFRKQ